ncbi:MAG: hypothetical protein ABSB76_31290 [Streptosporangiaceae bacterium]|jgi:hypothetical protein
MMQADGKGITPHPVTSAQESGDGELAPASWSGQGIAGHHGFPGVLSMVSDSGG